jgi:hypothetical protein
MRRTKGFKSGAVFVVVVVAVAAAVQREKNTDRNTTLILHFVVNAGRFKRFTCPFATAVGAATRDTDEVSNETIARVRERGRVESHNNIIFYIETSFARAACVPLEIQLFTTFMRFMTVKKRVQ